MFESLLKDFEGELYFRDTTVDEAIRTVYATDASVYQEKPIAVALPKSVQDIRQLIHFANTNQLTLIPRAAGTS